MMIESHLTSKRLTRSSVLVLAPSIMLRHADKICVNRESGALVELNSSAYVLLELLDGTHTVEELASVVANIMGVSAEEVCVDTLSFFEQLLDEGFLVQRGGSL